MSKRPSLFHELLCSLRDQKRFGESKHEAKRIAITWAHSQGRSGFGVAPEGVYSVVTFAGYRQVAHEFAAWCTKTGHARTMAEAKFWVPLYLAERICSGKSAWTVQRDRSALRKIYRDPNLACEVEVPRRRLTDIKRSRYPVKMDKQFDPGDYPELVDFCRAVGLRRHELAAVKPDNIYWRGGKLYVQVHQGKGGKPRDVTVVTRMQSRVLKIISDKPLDKPIFSHIPAKMDVHSYRAEYATTRLLEATEEKVTRDLGHNRVDVIRGHYTRR
ncbi:MAG: site-specific integrase [Syntrophomonadaceae bacterium]|nr:site-specific integrase [Syntrophomonadaceae bacterium]